jgi:uncharacterized protein YkwD
MANPTAREQELLELINRMRIAPSAELALLLASSDPAIKEALTYFKVDLDLLKAQWQKLSPVAPLAWSNQLSDAAVGHNRAIIQYDQQSHHVGVYDANGKLVTAYEPDLAGRLSATGYNFTHGRENIYGYASSIVYADTGFAIDWGEDANSVGGIQNPAGHRDTMMARDIREVGISVMDETNPNTKVGPLVVTEDFGNRAEINNKAWLLGVAFQDKNQDSWYEAGEGLNDVQVKITGIQGTNFSHTISVADTGGYQDLLDPGQYQVDFLRGGKVVKTQTTSIATKDPANVKLDLVLPVITIGTDPLGTTPNTTTGPTVTNPVANPAKTVESFLGTTSQTSDPNGKIFNFTVDNTQSNAAIGKTKSIAVTFTSVSADAAYHNYGGLYRIEDANGTVMDTDGQTYQPGDAKYLQAALRRSKMTADGTQLDRSSLNGDTTLKAGYHYAPFVVANGKVDDVLNATDPTKAASVFFNYAAANADGFEHFKLLGANKLGCEDTFGGGDRDYNDLIFQLNAKVV